MNPETAILLTLIAYKLVLVAIGLAARQRTRDGVDFFLGGRRLGPVVAALSASASSSSAWTLLGVSGAAYAWGLSAVWLFPACVGGFALNWYVLAPALRRESHRCGALTVTEFLAGSPGHRYRGAIVLLASLIILVSMGAYVASQFQGAGEAFGETFGLSPTASILIGAGVVLFYTLLGGFWGVSLTDTLQGLAMAASCLVLPVAALARVGGPAALIDGMREVSLDGYQSPFRYAEMTAGLGFVFGLLGIGLGYPGQPHVVNRFMALREGEADLKRGRRIAIGWAVVVYSGMLLLGWCGRVLFPGIPANESEGIFVRITNEILHPVVAGVMIAAVLSAIMSTADSQLLVAASSVTHDLELGGASRQGLLFRSRIVVFLLCTGAVLAALHATETIFNRVLFAWTAMGAAFGPLLLVTVLRGPVPPLRRLLAMALGFALAVTFYSLNETRGGAVERLVPFAMAFGVCLAPGKRSRRPASAARNE